MSGTVLLIRELRFDIVLMDIRMPALDGPAVTRRVTGHTDLTVMKVVMLATFELDEYVFEAIRSGVSGFLVKDTDPEELLRAAQAVVAGDALLPPAVPRRLIAEFATRSKEPVATGHNWSSWPTSRAWCGRAGWAELSSRPEPRQRTDRTDEGEN